MSNFTRISGDISFSFTGENSSPALPVQTESLFVRVPYEIQLSVGIKSSTVHEMPQSTLKTLLKADLIKIMNPENFVLKGMYCFWKLARLGASALWFVSWSPSYPAEFVNYIGQFEEFPEYVNYCWICTLHRTLWRVSRICKIHALAFFVSLVLSTSKVHQCRWSLQHQVLFSRLETNTIMRELKWQSWLVWCSSSEILKKIVGKTRPIVTKFFFRFLEY